MQPQYQFPLHIYLILEKLDMNVFTHNNLGAHHYVMVVPTEEIFNISCLLKNEVFLGLSYLTEISAVDTLKYNSFLPETSIFFSKNRILLFYIFYMYALKIRLSIFSLVNSYKSSIYSIETNFLNAT